MLAQTYSITHEGTSPCRIIIETDVFSGLPGISIVGLASKSIDESRERLRSAIRNSNLEFPPRKLTINMAPADKAKTGTGFDLAMAIGILVGTRQLQVPNLDKYCFTAELALDGSLRPARDCLASILGASEVGFETIVVDPTTNIDPELIDDITILRPLSLRELYLHFLGEKPLPNWIPVPNSIPKPDQSLIDLTDIRGLKISKRALEIAAAGHHNILLIGPPGTGKTLLAQALPAIMPTASKLERKSIAYLHSLASQAYPSTISGRPFRAPHHTASEVAIVGGGSQPRPGEISLAHNGILFMDEFVEFPKRVLEALRQPLEDSTITIARAADTLSFPANVLLIAAMNPCACGYLGSTHNPCSCSASQIQRYKQRLSGPLLDRFDLVCNVVPLNPNDWTSTASAETSATVAARVLAARQTQIKRNIDSFSPWNSRLSLRQLKNSVFSSDAKTYLGQIAQAGFLSTRGLSRWQKVARTIADLDNSLIINKSHLDEALYFRQHLLSDNTAAQSISTA